VDEPTREVSIFGTLKPALAALRSAKPPCKFDFRIALKTFGSRGGSFSNVVFAAWAGTSEFIFTGSLLFSDRSRIRLLPGSQKWLEKEVELNSSFRKLDMSVLGLGVQGGIHSSIRDPWSLVPAMQQKIYVYLKQVPCTTILALSEHLPTLVSKRSIRFLIMKSREKNKSPPIDMDHKREIWILIRIIC
jgi:hypothetical protein